MQYKVRIEFDPEGKVYIATVPGLSVYAQGRTEREAIKLVKEGLQLHLKETQRRRRLPQAARPVKGKLVTVEV